VAIQKGSDDMKENFHFELTAFMDDEFSMRVPENEDYGYWLLL